jgi:threonine dehydratase
MESSSPPIINHDRITATERVIRPYIRRTPVITVDGNDFGLGSSGLLALKLENLQHTGSFKPRGAFANLLTRQVPAAGVAAASGGNHGVAVAFAAMRLGIKATIFVAKITTAAKVDRIRAYGAELVVTGEVYPEAVAACEAYVAHTGALAIHPYDQPETILGQGSVGMELEADHSDIDTLLVAVGGGGLIGGIAAWYERRVRIIAVEPETAPTLHYGWRDRRRLAGAANGRHADVSDRAKICGQGGTRHR